LSSFLLLRKDYRLALGTAAAAGAAAGAELAFEPNPSFEMIEPPREVDVRTYTRRASPITILKK